MPAIAQPPPQPKITYNTPDRPFTWLITGCSSGLGLALARQVVAHGHRVIASSRNPAKSPELVKEIESHKGSRWITLDVLDDTTKIVDQLEAEGVAIDVLVNNAGHMTYVGVEQATEEEIRYSMDSFFFGPLRLIKAVLPHMRKRKFGVIVNIASGVIFEGPPSMAIYAGAKAGIDNLAKVLRKEIAPFNIRTLSVAIGTTESNMTSGSSYGSQPLPDDYKDGPVDKFIQLLKSGKVVPDGDPNKAMGAVFEVVTGTGRGKGKTDQRMLPLGRDVPWRLQGMSDEYASLQVTFEDIVNHVHVDGKASWP